MSKKSPLFGENFPTFSSNEELKALQDANPDIDSYYIATACIPERRKNFEEMFKLFKSDSNSLQKARKDGFHAFSWEVLMGGFLRMRGFNLEEHKDSGPDVITIEPHIYIECKVVGPGKKGSPDSIPERRIGVVSEIPCEKIKMRISGSIRDKAIQYKGWLAKNMVLSSVPYVMALNLGEIAESSCMLGIPYIVSSVLGIGNEVFNINTHSTSWNEQRVLYKANGEPVRLDYFLDPQFSFISGIIATSRYVIDGEMLSDMVYVANPLAINPIHVSTFGFMKCWIVDENGKLTTPQSE